MSKYGVPRVNVTFKDINKIEEGYRVYRNTTSFDETTLPTPLVDISAEDVANFKKYNYFDDDVLEGNTYFYRVGAYANGEEVLSDEKQILPMTPYPNVYIGTQGNEVKKIDHNGDGVWTYSGHTNHIKAITIDKDENVYSGSIIDGDLKKHDKDGNLIWSKKPGRSSINSIAVDLNGNVYVDTGLDYSIKKYDRNGTFQWEYNGHTSTINDIKVDINGNIYTASNDFRTCMIDSNGNELWRYNLGDRAYSVGVDSEGYVYVGGHDFYIRKIYNGNYVSAIPYGGSGSSIVHDISIDNVGNLYIAGRNEVNFMSKILSNGSIEWTKNNVVNYKLAIDADNNFYISETYTILRKYNKDNQLIWEYDNNGRGVYGIAVYPGPLFVANDLPF